MNINNNSGTGFAHFVVDDDFGNSFLLLGSHLGDGLEGGELPVLLESADGQTLEVSKASLMNNYRLQSKIRIAQAWTGSISTLIPVSPVFVSFSGFRVALIGVASLSLLDAHHRCALYQRVGLAGGGSELFTMPLDEFYDSFSLVTEVTVSSPPYEIDENGVVGYIANRTALDSDKYPLSEVVIDSKSKTMLVKKC